MVAFIVLFLPASSLAQSAAEKALKIDTRGLVDILRKASRNEIYLIDEVALTCSRITSGLKQRNTVYFKTSDNTESSELFLDGGGTLRFNAKGRAAVDCGISNEVSFQISSSGRNIWRADYASGYCIRAVIYDNCTYSCSEYADIGSKLITFANDKEIANEINSATGGDECVE